MSLDLAGLEEAALAVPTAALGRGARRRPTARPTLAPVPDGMLTTAEVAKLIGVTPGSLRTYVSRGDGPKPDGHLGRTPWWKPETVEAWLAARPGQGTGGGRPRKASS